MRALAVEGAERRPHGGLELRVAGAQAGVPDELGVVAAQQRQLHRAGDQLRGDPGRTGRAEVHEVVAALGQRLHDRGQ